MHLRARLAPDHSLELANHRRERMRTGGRAEQIMRGLEARRPVAQRFVDRVLERPPAACHRDHRRAHQLHPEDVELLPLDIVRAHVDDGLETEQRADDRRRDTMLAGSGLGDQPGLAHALREQALRQHLIGLVRAAVKQVLAFQIDIARQIAAAGQRRRPSGVIGEQVVELGGEGGIVLRVEERGLELLERGNEDLREHSSRRTGQSGRSGAFARALRDGGRRASNSAAIFSADLRPGWHRAPSRHRSHKRRAVARREHCAARSRRQRALRPSRGVAARAASSRTSGRCRRRHCRTPAGRRRGSASGSRADAERRPDFAGPATARRARGRKRHPRARAAGRRGD